MRKNVGNSERRNLQIRFRKRIFLCGRQFRKLHAESRKECQHRLRIVQRQKRIPVPAHELTRHRNRNPVRRAADVTALEQLSRKELSGSHQRGMPDAETVQPSGISDFNAARMNHQRPAALKRRVGAEEQTALVTVRIPVGMVVFTDNERLSRKTGSEAGAPVIRARRN